MIAPVFSLDAARSRRRPPVRATRFPAEHAAGIVRLSDEEFDDELRAAAADADAELTELLHAPVPAAEDRRLLLVARCGARLALAALHAAECDAAQGDARASWRDEADALLGRLCELRGSGR